MSAAAPEGKQAIGRATELITQLTGYTESTAEGLNTNYTTEMSEGSKSESGPGPSLGAVSSISSHWAGQLPAPSRLPGQVFSAARFGSVQTLTVRNSGVA